MLMLCSFAGCSKKKSQPQLSYPLSKDALAYIQLTVGKYFIYRDSTTNKTDSVTVLQSDLTADNYTDDGAPVAGQQYTLILTASGTVWLSGNCSGQLLGRVQLTATDNSYNLLFRDVTTILPSVTVEGTTYTNVSLTTNDLESGFGANAIISAYYWAKGVGLIKRRETKNSVTTTYTLVRHD